MYRGGYICIVYNCVDQPNVHYQPTNLTIVQNNSITIPCEITIGEATVDYFWLLNDNHINLSSPRYTMREGTGNITITSVQAEDEGVYECLGNVSLSDNMADDLRFLIGSGTIAVVCKLTIYSHSTC